MFVAEDYRVPEHCRAGRGEFPGSGLYFVMVTLRVLRAMPTMPAELKSILSANSSNDPTLRLAPAGR